MVTMRPVFGMYSRTSALPMTPQCRFLRTQTVLTLLSSSSSWSRCRAMTASLICEMALDPRSWFSCGRAPSSCDFSDPVGSPEVANEQHSDPRLLADGT